MKKLFLFAVVFSLCLYLPLDKVAAGPEEGVSQEQASSATSSNRKGDYEKARQLKEQLRAARQENKQEIQQNVQALKEARQELKHDAGQAHPRAADRLEDIRDRRENVRDRVEAVRDRREDVRDRRKDRGDRRENIRDWGQQQGVRDHGAGIGRGAGQGGAHRSEAARPAGGGRHR